MSHRIPSWLIALTGVGFGTGSVALAGQVGFRSVMPPLTGERSPSSQEGSEEKGPPKDEKESPGFLPEGLELGAGYKSDVFYNFTGGAKTGFTFLGNVDLSADLDGEALIGWKGGALSIALNGTHGGDPTSFVGDTQGTSNIEAPTNTLRLYSAWIQQSFAEEQVSILGGLYDLNSEFYSTDSSGLFFNSSFGVGKEFSQTGGHGPSIFPVTSLALRVKAEIESGWYIQSAVFDGVPGDPENPAVTAVLLGSKDGLLMATEFGYTLPSGKEEDAPRSKYGVGVWSYTDQGDHTKRLSSNRGFYGLIDQQLGSGFSVFLRSGLTTRVHNEVNVNVATGAAKAGIGSREADQIGFGVTVATPSGGAAQPEVAVEGTYRFQFGDHFAVQPDVQAVVNPGLSSRVKPSVSSIIRMELSF